MWETRLLEEIGQWGSGGTPLASKQEYYGGSIPWLIIEDLNDGLVNKSQKTITELGLRNSSAKVVGPGTLLIAMYGSIGKLGIAGFKCATNQAIAFCHCDPKLVDVKFLFYFLLNSRHKLNSEGRGGTQQNISQALLKDFPISLPPLPEQKRIAAILDKADRLRRTRRYAQQLSDTFLQSVFLEMFGDPRWNSYKFETQKAGSLFDIQLGKMLDAKRFKGTHLRPYLGNSNVKWGSFDLSDLKHMDFDDADFRKFKLQKDDLLVCEGGEVGRTAIWNEEIPNCCYQKALHRLRPKDEQISVWYFLYFMRVAVNFGLIQRETSTVTIAHFTAEKFNEFDIIVPPLPLQEKFARIVQQFERLRGQQREAERQAEHLFGTLLQRAFRGELS